MNGIRKHYHWAIALVVLIELAVFSGILNNIIGLHLIPVTEDLGISRGSFSLAFSIRPLLGFFSTLFSGVLFVKHGYRKLASIFLLVAAIAFGLLGISQNFLMLAIASAILGLSEGFCTTAAASRMVNTWFHSHQGMILGLVTASTGLGGSLFSVVLSRTIFPRFLWRLWQGSSSSLPETAPVTLDFFPLVPARAMAKSPEKPPGITGPVMKPRMS